MKGSARQFLSVQELSYLARPCWVSPTGPTLCLACGETEKNRKWLMPALKTHKLGSEHIPGEGWQVEISRNLLLFFFFLSAWEGDQLPDHTCWPAPPRPHLRYMEVPRLGVESEL